MLCFLSTLLTLRHWCLWLLHNTVYRVMKCQNSTLLCIKWPLTHLGGKSCTAFCLVGLAVHQSEKVAFLTFLDLSTTSVIAGKTHSQSPILKTKGTLSNPGFLQSYEQSCILHTLTKTACLYKILIQ